MSLTEDTGSVINFGTGVVFGTVLLLGVVYRSTRRAKNLPPGPPALPIVGSAPFLKSKDIRVALNNAREMYVV